MQKKPPSGPPSRPPSRPPARPQLQRATPPRPMVTAVERRQLKEARRATALPPAAPAPAAAGTTVDPLQAEIDRFNGLQGKLMLTQIQDDVEDIETAINALPANAENIRARGYVFKSYLERKIETLTTQWRDVRPRVTTALQQHTAALQADANQVQVRLSRRTLAGPALTALETKLGAAISALEGMYDTLDDNVNQTQQQLDDISWTLQQSEQACFGFLAAESPIEAVPANWKKPGDKDGVDGVLFLTDQRLIFEQKEEVATKKVLFITTAKETVQNLAWAVAVSQIAKATGSKKGFMGKDDYLTVELVDGATFAGPGDSIYYDGLGRPLNSTDLHLKGEAGAAWQGHIGRVKSGEIARERTVPLEAEAVEAVANAPTKCSTCGATLTEPVLRGQTEITCPYCGSVMRL